MAAADILPVIAPEIPGGVYATWVGYAQLQINLNVWPSAKVDMATALLAAHLYTRLSGTKGKGVGGAVIEQQDGQVHQAYATPEDDDDFKTTRYGMRYLQLRRSIPTTPLFI